MSRGNPLLGGLGRGAKAESLLQRLLRAGFAPSAQGMVMPSGLSSRAEIPEIDAILNELRMQDTGAGPGMTDPMFEDLFKPRKEIAEESWLLPDAAPEPPTPGRRGTRLAMGSMEPMTGKQLPLLFRNAFQHYEGREPSVAMDQGWPEGGPASEQRNKTFLEKKAESLEKQGVAPEDIPQSMADMQKRDRMSQMLKDTRNERSGGPPSSERTLRSLQGDGKGHFENAAVKKFHSNLRRVANEDPQKAADLAVHQLNNFEKVVQDRMYTVEAHALRQAGQLERLDKAGFQEFIRAQKAAVMTVNATIDELSRAGIPPEYINRTLQRYPGVMGHWTDQMGWSLGQNEGQLRADRANPKMVANEKRVHNPMTMGEGTRRAESYGKAVGKDPKSVLVKMMERGGSVAGGEVRPVSSWATAMSREALERAQQGQFVEAYMLKDTASMQMNEMIKGTGALESRIGNETTKGQLGNVLAGEARIRPVPSEHGPGDYDNLMEFEADEASLPEAARKMAAGGDVEGAENLTRASRANLENLERTAKSYDEGTPERLSWQKTTGRREAQIQLAEQVTRGQRGRAEMVKMGESARWRGNRRKPASIDPTSMEVIKRVRGMASELPKKTPLLAKLSSWSDEEVLKNFAGQAANVMRGAKPATQEGKLILAAVGGGTKKELGGIIRQSPVLLSLVRSVLRAAGKAAKVVK